MGLTPGPHGMHIYEMPFLGGDCLSAGDHYNPQKTEHGGKHDWNRHIGDLGNIFADANGVASFDLTDLLISLTGGYSIVNRTIAVIIIYTINYYNQHLLFFTNNLSKY